MLGFCSDLPSHNLGGDAGVHMAVSGRLLGLEVGCGLFKPMAVTVSFPGQGPHGDLLEMRHLRPYLGPLS